MKKMRTTLDKIRQQKIAHFVHGYKTLFNILIETSGSLFYLEFEVGLLNI